MHRYRKHSIEYIIEELKYIKEMGFTHIAFVDDSFLFKGSQAEELFDQIIYENLHLKFYIAAARVDSADINLYRKLRRAGVVYIQQNFCTFEKQSKVT
ncbi:MAG: hypothetical protein DRN12_05700 [Thermoplasmata archaeon]|nr:MAG: hypothetical protein DRN12_05700 [Thermoplasmata archaeon]